LENDPCKGCMYRGVGRKVCDTCSRRYLDRYKPMPPPKKISPAAVQLLTLAAITSAQTPYERKEVPHDPIT
jgi:hypothetical protein